MQDAPEETACLLLGTLGLTNRIIRQIRRRRRDQSRVSGKTDLSESGHQSRSVKPSAPKNRLMTPVAIGLSRQKPGGSACRGKSRDLVPHMQFPTCSDTSASPELERGGDMTTHGARSAFLRSYDIPAILSHYPRMVRAMQGIVILNGAEAAACILDLKAGRRWSSEAVNRYGGTRKVAGDAWRYRNVARMLRGVAV